MFIVSISNVGDLQWPKWIFLINNGIFFPTIEETLLRYKGYAYQLYISAFIQRYWFYSTPNFLKAAACDFRAGLRKPLRLTTFPVLKIYLYSLLGLAMAIWNVEQYFCKRLDMVKIYWWSHLLFPKFVTCCHIVSLVCVEVHAYDQTSMSAWMENLQSMMY